MNAFLSDATARWLLVELARTTLLVAVLGGVCWLLLRVTRASSPTLHRVCCLAVLLAGWTVLQWPVDVAWYDAPVIEQASVQPAQDRTPKRFTPPIDPALLSAPPEFGAGISTPSSAPVESPAALSPEVLPPGAPPQPIAAAESQPAWNVTWEYWALTSWFGGIVAMVSIWLVGYLRFLRQLPRGLECPPEWQAEFTAIAQEQGRGARVEFRLTDDLGPLLCRLPRRTVLLVPLSLWSELAAAERRAILRHELAHLHRGDLWKSLAVRVLALPHWFNPVAWLAVRRFDDAAEWACDRAAMGEEPTTYAAMLLRLGELAGTRARFGSAMSNRPLTTRIRRLLTLAGTEDSAMKKACLMSLLLLVVPLALVRVNLVAEEPKQPAADAPPQQPADAAELPAPVTDAAGELAPPTAELEPPVAEQPDTAVKAAQRKMVAFAKKTYEVNAAAYKAGTITLDQLFHWSNLWLSAELAMAESREEQLAAAQRNLARLKVVEANIRRLYEHGSRGGEQNAMSAANYHVADAERRLAEIEAMPEPIGELEAPKPDREMVESAKRAFEATKHAYETRHSTLENHLPWSARWLAAELAVAPSHQEQLAAARAHVDRMQKLHDRIARLQRSGAPGGEATQLEAANYYLVDARQRLAEIERLEERLGIQLPPTSTRIHALPSPEMSGSVQSPVPSAPAVTPYAAPYAPPSAGYAVPYATPQPDAKVKLGNKEYFVDDPELNKAIGAGLESKNSTEVLEAVNAVRRRGLSLNGSVAEVISTGFAARLAQLLGHPDPQVRDRAEAVLWTTAGVSTPEVKQAAESDNPEIAKRARRLMEHTGPIIAAEKARRAVYVPFQQPSVQQPSSETDKRSLYYNGKTFDQWRTQLTTDLSPTLRSEAIYAMGEFAKNGYGPEAAGVIFEAAKAYPATKSQNHFEREVQNALVYAAERVPAADILPLITRQLKSESPVERLFAIQLVPLDPPSPGVAELLEKSLGDSDPRVAREARSLLTRADGTNAKLDQWIRDSLAQGDHEAIAEATELVLTESSTTPLGRTFHKRPYVDKLPEVVALLRHPDESVRDRTVFRLNRDREGYKWLSGALQELVNGGGPDAQLLGGKLGIDVTNPTGPIDRRR